MEKLPCVLGVLRTEEGLKIKNEMLEWLEPFYDVFCVEQEPPGKLFEYPAIKTAIRMANDLKSEVLYLHTKGASNIIPLDYKDRMMHESINVPKNAKPEDCQKIVRNMWKYEFATKERLDKYKKALSTDSPTIACPYTGVEKITWQNGFFINYAAAQELKSFKFCNSRYYYEVFLKDFKKINCIGLRFNNCNRNVFKNKIMWDDIWTFL